MDRGPYVASKDSFMSWRFIGGFSNVAWPLFDLTKKDVRWTWGNAEASAFQALKDLVTPEPVLILPDTSQPYRLEVDSLDFATGAVLSQSGPDEKWHPVAFFSKASVTSSATTRSTTRRCS